MESSLHSWRSYRRRGGCWELKKKWDCQKRQGQHPVWPFLLDQWDIFSECYILLFIILDLPPPSSALLPPLLFSVANYCPRERTKEQQGDTIWCIVGSSAIHTEVSVKSVVDSSGCVLHTSISVILSVLFIKVLFLPQVILVIL